MKTLSFTSLLIIAIFQCDFSAGQKIDLRREYQRLTSTPGMQRKGFSFTRLGFISDIKTAKLAELEGEYTPPPGGESSAYWHNSYGALVKGAYLYGDGCFAIAHAHQLRLISLVDGLEMQRLPPLSNPFIYGLVESRAGAHLLCVPRRASDRPIDINGSLSVFDVSTGELIGSRAILSLLETTRNESLGKIAASGLANEAGIIAPAFVSKSGLSKTNFCIACSNGMLIASAHKNGEIVLWDSTKGRLLRKWQLPSFRQGSRGARYLSFSPDGSRLVASNFGDLINDLIHAVVLDTSTGDLICALPLKRVMWVPGREYVIGEDYHDDPQVWSTLAGGPVAAPAYFSVERYHAMKTPGGYFTASQETLAFLRKYHDRLNPYGRGVDFIERYYRPDIVKRILAGMPPDLAEQLPADYAQPTSSLHIVSLSKSSAKVAFRASVTGEETTLKGVRLERKERPFSAEVAKQWASLDGDEVALDLPFPPGKNEMTITATVTDSYGVESRPSELRLERPQKVEELSGRLFVLAIGVGQHKFPEYNLDFPAIDAKALANELKRQEGLVFGEVHTQVYTDDRATLTNVRDGLAWLERVATSDDVAVVFVAGHGLRGRRGLYYVTHEGDAQAIQYTCLNWEEVAKSMEKTKAKQLIFLSDVCHGGGFAQSDLAMQGDLVKRVSKIDRTLVFAASGADELAVESDELKHGAFTSALLSGLAGQADANTDQAISLGELVGFTTTETKRLTGDAQSPYIASTAGFDRALVLSRAAGSESVREVRENVSPGSPSIPAAADASELQPAAVAPATPERGQSTENPVTPPSATEKDGEEFVNSIGMRLKRIPAGEFWMGSSDEDLSVLKAIDPGSKVKHHQREQPRHRVRLTGDFYAGAYEVTRGQYAQFVGHSKYVPESERLRAASGIDIRTMKGSQDRKYSWRYTGFHQDDNHPVVNVSKQDAIEFCRWLSKEDGRTYRLPTEAEWEYCARANTDTVFPFGNETRAFTTHANSRDESARLLLGPGRPASVIVGSDRYAFTAPVGSFKANAFGLHDMIGNVWEWCDDSPDWAYYSKSPRTNPVCRIPGADSTSGGIVRGGSWVESARGCRPAIRIFVDEGLTGYAFGFRVVAEMPDPKQR